MSQIDQTENKTTPWRYTVDGSDALEDRIHALNDVILQDILEVVPEDQIDALVLAGGYGRGEGGVYVKDGDETLYNDLDYYLFLKGNKRENETRYGPAIKQIEKLRSPEADCDVEFKIDSIHQLEVSPVSMFTYDLVAKSFVVGQGQDVFAGSQAHLQSKAIPVSEATRLLFNRCSGLIFARQRLRQEALSEEDLEFVQRNLAKVELAMGDAVLTVQGDYHWSVRERHQRLQSLSPDTSLPRWEEVLRAHANGLHFKLRPLHEPKPIDILLSYHESLSQMVKEIWFWVENQRLNENVQDALDYATASNSRCPDQPAWRNALVNVRRFGVSSLFRPFPFRYPREQLYRSMALLLWLPDAWENTDHRTRLQALLRIESKSREELIAQYETLWHSFG